MSDLIGERLPADLQRAWTTTTQFSGFDAVPWTQMDAKALRDRTETLETILDRALVSTKVMACSVASADRLSYASCAKQIVEQVATRAFGRPLRDTERASLEARYEDAVVLARTALTDPAEIFRDGVRAALGTVLLAVQFVTRIEAPPHPDFIGERDLDAFELASRLSFLFTASIPDDELWSTALDGSLAQTEVLRAQTERLLTTKTDVFVQTFMGQWFDFRAYESAEAGPLEHAMWGESWRTLVDVVKQELPITALVEPGFTYVNGELAKHYSLVGDFPAELTRVPSFERGGVLQQGSWLSFSATPAKTSPIHRGRLVQDRLLCKVVPPPDSAMFDQIQKVSQSISPSASVKERLEAHRAAGPACSGCHEYMDPIGLGLEGFDGRGRLRRAYDSGKPVEVASQMLGQPFATFAELNHRIAVLPDYHRCAAEKLAIYALRRVVDANTPSDADLLDHLARPLNDEPPSVREMIFRLVTSNAFRKVSHGGST